MPNTYGKIYTGSIQGSNVDVQTGSPPSNNLGIHHELFFNVDELTATTGTIDVQLLPPGLTEYVSYDNSTYTVGTTNGLYIKNCVFISVKLVPSGLDAAVTYSVYLD